MKDQDKNKGMGHLFVITGPSGTGKNTIIDIVTQRIDNLAYSVSHTTRKPRSGEIDGKDYYFVDQRTFQRMIDDREFIEWARVYSDLYGTSFSSIRDKLRHGIDMILDLDIQGAMNMKRHFKNITLIFVLPPSLEELRKRLIKRGAEDKVIKERLSQTLDEIRMAKKYDYIVINDELEKAIKETESIIISERIRTERRLSYINSFFDSTNTH